MSIDLFLGNAAHADNVDANYTPYYAMDDIDANYMRLHDPAVNVTRVEVDCKSPVIIESVTLKQLANFEYVTLVEFQGSNNPIGDWHNLATIACGFGTTTQAITQTVPYRYYRLNPLAIPASNNGYWRLDSLQGFGQPGTPEVLPRGTDLFRNKTVTMGGGGTVELPLSRMVDGDDSYFSAATIFNPVSGSTYIIVDTGRRVRVDTFRYYQREPIQYAFVTQFRGSNDLIHYDLIGSLTFLVATVQNLVVTSPQPYRYYMLFLENLVFYNNHFWRVNSLEGYGRALVGYGTIIG